MLQNDQEKPLKTFTLYTKSYKAACIASFPVISEYLIINIRAVLAAQDREANIPVYISLCLKEDAAASRNARAGSLLFWGLWQWISDPISRLGPHWQSASFLLGLPNAGTGEQSTGNATSLSCPSLVSWGKGYRSLLALLCFSCSF